MTGAVFLVITYAIVFALHLVVPGRWVDGYVKGEDGKPLRYRLNGLRVFFITVALWALACWQGVLEWTDFHAHRWEMLWTACAIGLVFTFVVVFSAKPVRGLLADLYLGRRENPQALGGKLDAKMWLYLIGATMLELNLLSSVAAHLEAHRDDPSPGVLISAALFTFFLVEYLNFEEVHLYTYDFMAERVGFKLGWGCLTFYPFFYGVGLWTRADSANPHTHPLLLALCVVCFFLGWAFARGANLQKFHFKRDPTRKFLGITPEALEGRVLVNGFWGLSRHINYLGEILMALGITLSLGAPLAWSKAPWGDAVGWVAWLYPLYYLVLLLPRQLDDDRRCAKKYGPLWETYVSRVRYRIIPFIY